MDPHSLDLVAAMLTVIIPTRESERTLVQTLSPLVAGATAGLIVEVIVADAGSRDATAEVADIAGCQFLQGQKTMDAGLRAAAELARTPWLLFLRPGVVPESGWLEAVQAFMQGDRQAASFALARRARSWGRLFGPSIHPDQGLLIRKQAYAAAGGHPAGEDNEAALLRRLGRIPLLAASVRRPIT
jgi:glycosyltransferase involved in cell wall biosynthesis